MLQWDKLSETIQSVGHKTIVTKYFRMPDGHEDSFEIYGTSGAQNVATIALTPDKKVVVARQFRPGPEAIFDELPGGGVDRGEAVAHAAARELQEETGYSADPDKLTYLGKTYRDAYTNEVNHYFIAYECTRQTDQTLDSNEFIDVVTMSIKQLIDNARSARMSDGVAIAMAYEQLKAIGEVS